MPSEVTKCHNYLCDDVMHGANLRQNFPDAAIPVNYTSEFQALSAAITDKCLTPEHMKCSG
jgi:hypothetical protein